MSFQQGLSGLNGAAKNLDVIGNNVANAATVGFKTSATQFADVYANSLAGGGGASIGLGVQVADVAQNFSQGSMTTTANPLDLAINGGGFYRLSDNGTITYTRNGQFHLDDQGYVINATGERLTGYLANATGAIVAGAPVDLQISFADIAPNRTTQADVLANLDSRNGTLAAASFNINDPATYHNATSMTVFDSLGNPHTLSLYFVKTAANTWSVFGGNDGAQIGAGALGTLAFTTSGAINTGATTFPSVVALTATTGAVTPYNVTLDFAGSTQFGSPFGVTQLTQDGYASGRLIGFSVGADGIVLGRYSNGQSRAQGQVALANFTNANGLQPLGNNQWAETPESGQPLVGAPNTGTLGVLQSGAVEESNVDLTQELVNMITAQRVYQANAQTIKTQDQVLQTLVNLR
jgi:flagellar hook protein FlgE